VHDVVGEVVAREFPVEPICAERRPASHDHEEEDGRHEVGLIYEGAERVAS
jgi:hypothetical protein